MARDLYHALIRRALESDGWLITHDPLTLKYGEQTNLYVDLGAEAPEGRDLASEFQLHFILYDTETERIVRWIE
ncbi:element excision factor XisH family protein [Armatimonas sp.]|uniref:element excision factor XisH family protein n=1 Tax=Armatimonas sp. TaxID=1872638 RepID=UPI0037529EC4